MGNLARRLLLGLAVAAAVPALAAPRTLLVGAGDCASPDLLTNLARLDAALRAQPNHHLVDPGLALAIVRPGTTQRLEDLKQQVESARSLIYGGQPERSLELLRQAITELDKVSPEAGPWPVLTDALATEAVVLRQLGKKPEGVEALRRILRVEPGFALDPDYYTPASLQTFEQVKKELARTKKLGLTVESTPPGATVYVDGRAFGSTPQRLELVPGSYRVYVGQAEGLSFLHPLELTHDDVLKVELAFEGSVGRRLPLCVGPSKDPAAAAVRLGTIAAVEEVIVFGLDSKLGDPLRFRAAVHTLQPVRKDHEHSVRAESLGQLARYLVTRDPDDLPPEALVAQKAGEGSAASSAVRAPAAVTGGKDAPTVASTVTPVSTTAPVASPAAPAPEVRASHGRPAWVPLALGGAGVLALAAGGVTWGLGAADRARLAELTLADGRLVAPPDPGHAEALGLVQATDANQSLTAVLGAAGVGLLAAGAATWLLFPAEVPAHATAVVGPGSVGAAVSGSF